MSSKSSAGEARPAGSVTIPFGERFAGSAKFAAVFREGMALVEETAAYLDGDGRRDAKSLPPTISLLYAAESMRLTTRLMQIASWLLIRRAVNEGELTAEQAIEENTKVKLKPEQSSRRVEGFDQLPERLRTLIRSSLALNRRIVRLDQLLHVKHAVESANTRHPLGDHMARLQEVFGNGGKAQAVGRPAGKDGR